MIKDSFTQHTPNIDGDKYNLYGGVYLRTYEALDSAIYKREKWTIVSEVRCID